MSTPYTIQVGQRLTDYSSVDVTVERVAHGGMGIVAIGPCRIHNRMVALKTMKPGALAANLDIRDRFIRECLMWCGLWPHPNILLAERITEIDGLPFLVLEYAEHGSLAAILVHGRLPLASALAIVQHITAGLVIIHTPDLAHLRTDPIVHRDLKPDNVLIRQIRESQYAQITDFGLVTLLPHVIGSSDLAAGALVEDTRSPLHFQTRQGSVLGTVVYMAPEQWQDINLAGPPVDMYALGLILAECITGAHPLLSLHQRHRVEQWRAAHVQETPQRLQAVVSEVPVPLERLFLSLLAKRAADRPTAAETLAALNDVAQRLSLPTYTPPEIYAHTPENEGIYWQITGKAYASFQFWTEALVRNDRAVQLAPDNSTVLFTRGNILKGMRRWAEALECYRASLQALPYEGHLGSSSIYSQIGNLHSQQKQYAAAEAAYIQALDVMPETAFTWCNRGANEMEWGLAEAQAGQREASLTHLQRAQEYAKQSWTLNSADALTLHLLEAIEKAMRQVE